MIFSSPVRRKRSCHCRRRRLSDFYHYLLSITSLLSLLHLSTVNSFHGATTTKPLIQRSWQQQHQHQQKGTIRCCFRIFKTAAAASSSRYYAASASSSSDEDFYSNDESSNSKSSNNNSHNNSRKSPNEFSRTVSTNRIFPSTRPYADTTQQQQQQQQREQQQRDYELAIEATSDECQALCQRFDLTQLDALQASLRIRPAMSAVGFGSTMVLPVEVEGTIQASLVQTCVRTNERFAVQVEVPFYCVVKPMEDTTSTTTTTSNGDSNDYYYNEDEEDDTPKKKQKKQQQNSKKRNRNQASLDDLFDLQAAIQGSIDRNDGLGGASSASASSTSSYGSSGSGSSGSSSDTLIVEDAFIYDNGSGRLDVGELVAQTFWLQLDPFPKKPGTGPIQMEITG